MNKLLRAQNRLKMERKRLRFNCCVCAHGKKSHLIIDRKEKSNEKNTEKKFIRIVVRNTEISKCWAGVEPCVFKLNLSSWHYWNYELKMEWNSWHTRFFSSFFSSFSFFFYYYYLSVASYIGYWVIGYNMVTYTDIHNNSSLLLLLHPFECWACACAFSSHFKYFSINQRSIHRIPNTERQTPNTKIAFHNLQFNFSGNSLPIWFQKRKGALARSFARSTVQDSGSIRSVYYFPTFRKMLNEINRQHAEYTHDRFKIL